MPLKRFEKLSLEQQSEILDVARTEFVKHGFDGMSLNLLLQEMNVTKGQFYYWFEDKADLFLTLLQEAATNINQVVRNTGLPSSPDTFWDHLGRYQTEMDAWWADNPHHISVYARAIELIQLPSHPLISDLESLYSPLQKHFLETLRLGVDWGLVRCDIPLDGVAFLADKVNSGFDMYGMVSFQKIDLEGWAPPERFFEICSHLRRTTLRALLEMTA